MTTSCHNGAREQRAGRPEVWRFGEVSSALDVGHTLARRGLLAPWQSVLVSSQRQGRGRLRRNWVSPAGNIYAALRLPMQEPFASSAASTVTGAMLAAALGKLGFEVRLKWPNDLAVLDGDTPAKVAGILLEERAGVLLAGIGINVAWAPPAETLRAGAAMPAKALVSGLEKSQKIFLTAESLWYQLVNCLFCEYSTGGSLKKNWKDLAESFLLWRGSCVCLDDGDEVVEGILTGLCHDGGLCLSRNGRQEVFYSGSLRLSHHY